MNYKYIHATTSCNIVLRHIISILNSSSGVFLETKQRQQILIITQCHGQLESTSDVRWCCSTKTGLFKNSIRVYISTQQ